MLSDGVFVGVDVGSTTVKVAGLGAGGTITGDSVYVRLDEYASQFDAVKSALDSYLGSAGRPAVAGLGVTGSGRELTALMLGADIGQSEIFAHAAGLNYLLKDGHVPDVSTPGALIEIGGQDSKLVCFDADGTPAYFNMNTICSAGTGEFLKQLADEAGIAIEQLGSIALASTAPAVIDATCTVFSKRDFRHLTQKGVPLADRLMGACLALARNYVRNVVREAQIKPPVFFQGGVAANEAARLAFRRELGMDVLVTPFAGVVGALGMAVSARDAASSGLLQATRFRADYSSRSFSTRARYCRGCANGCALSQPYEVRDGHEVIIDTLGGRCGGCRDPRNVVHEPPAAAVPATGVAGAAVAAGAAAGRLPSTVVPASRRRRVARPPDLIYSGSPPTRSAAGQLFAGLDGGSRGTKYALIRASDRRSAAGRGPDVEVVCTGSVDTAGDAIAALMQALAGLKSGLGQGAECSAIGTTGSAGELFRDIITTRSRNTADHRCTEVVAHYVWASHWCPSVRAVIDIGGNDAKLIVVGDGGLDFAMNDKCAAGTGSFLEAAARRFNVSLQQFAQEAEAASVPAQVAGRCAVFGESDMIHKSRLGFARGDLFRGLCQAVCRTFLSDLGRGRTVMPPVIAQGGGFLLRPLQAAFREALGMNESEFLVADDPESVLCAGALGAALMAMGRWEQGYDSHFKGFDAVLSASFTTVSARCREAGCGRRCDNVVALLENGAVVAGYKGVDCAFRHFTGLAEAEAERRHIEAMLKESACACAR